MLIVLMVRLGYLVAQTHWKEELKYVTIACGLGYVLTTKALTTIMLSVNNLDTWDKVKFLCT